MRENANRFLFDGGFPGNLILRYPHTLNRPKANSALPGSWEKPILQRRVLRTTIQNVAVSGWRLKPEGVRSTLLFFCFLNIFLLPDPILMTGFYLLDISQKIDFWIIIFIKIRTGRACPGRYHSLEWNIILCSASGWSFKPEGVRSTLLI